MIKTVFTLIFLMFAISAQTKELPSQFESNLIYLTPKLKDGNLVRFFTDTGGGWNAISKELADSYHWPVYEKQGDSNLIYVTDMPTFDKETAIPIAGLHNWWEGRLQVVPRAKMSRSNEIDGVLGGRWHAEKIVDFDYPSMKISVLSALPAANELSMIKLGFQKNSQGSYTTAFPSLEIKVDGQVIPMLLDTGASAFPSSEAAAVLRLSDSQVATSFIVASIFDKWVENHPDWHCY